MGWIKRGRGSVLSYSSIDETDAQKQSRHGYRLDQVEKINHK